MNKIAVVGAGVMGTGIAAQVANAGVPVLLLDRAGIAQAALDRAGAAPFMSETARHLVQTGDSDTDLARIGDCDWIIEVVVEDRDVKRTLYRRIEAVRRPDAAVSSNTSTFRLADLLNDLPARFARAFLITHFFNPPRQMRLLEVVTGPQTDPEISKRVLDFCDRSMGKTTVACHDSPGFIANRIGAYWLQLGVNAALDLGLTVEEADAAMGRAAGIPKTGVFGLIDLIGLDLLPRIVDSLRHALPASDKLHATIRDWPLLSRLIEGGYTGRKGAGGFYRLDRSGGGKVKQALDLVTGEYRPEQPPDFSARDLRALLSLHGKIGDYSRQVLGGTLAYAASLVPEATDTVVAIDTAMRLGYNWKRGPFEMIDAIGGDGLGGRLPAGEFYRNGAYRDLDGIYREPPRTAGVLLLDGVKRARPLLQNGSAALWDVGDGVTCFEMTTKLGSFDVAIMELLKQTVEFVARRFKALVIGHDADNFSAGANLSLILAAAKAAAWDDVASLVDAGQTAFTALKYAPFPVVAAVSGLALGGGCEIVLHADAVQAHAETTIGLVECGVGLVPGWGGTGELLLRCGTATRAFEMVSAAITSHSAAHAKELSYLRPDDGITMNRDRLLADACVRALAMVEGYRPPPPPTFRLVDPAERAAMLHGLVCPSEHDLVVATALADVLTGSDEVSEAELLARERTAFLRLVHEPKTLARIEHTLATGQRLRN